MKLAINQGTLFNAPTEKFLELCHEYGIKAVELRAPLPSRGALPPLLQRSLS